MFCIHCGTQIPDQSEYCSKCGKPQKQVGFSSNVEQQYEVGEIVLGKRHAGFEGVLYWFCVEVMGPKGLTTIGKTQELHGGSHTFEFPKNSDKNANTIHTKLVNDLLAEGWEPVQDNRIAWWNYKFRRKLQNTKARKCEIIAHIDKRQLIPPSVEFTFQAIQLGVDKSVLLESPRIVIKGKEGLYPEQEKTSPHVISAYKSFVNQILQSGWVADIQSGKYWWSNRFIENPRE